MWGVGSLHGVREREVIMQKKGSLYFLYVTTKCSKDMQHAFCVREQIVWTRNATCILCTLTDYVVRWKPACVREQRTWGNCSLHFVLVIGLCGEVEACIMCTWTDYLEKKSTMNSVLANRLCGELAALIMCT